MFLSMSCTELEKYIRSTLSLHRAKHSVSCAHMLERIFQAFPVLLEHYPREAALYTGLLHDVAREWPESQVRGYIARHRIPVEPEEETSFPLLHAPAGAHFASLLIPGFPPEWSTAIRWHTLGSRDMGLLGAALYLADYVEPLRTYMTDSRRSQLLSYPDLETVMLDLLEEQEIYLEKKKLVPSSSARALLAFLREGETLV